VEGVKKKTDWGRIAAVFLILAGALLALYPFLERAAGEKRARRMADSFCERAAELYPKDEEAKTAKAGERREPPTADAEGNAESDGEGCEGVFEDGVIGVIEIESIGIRYPVMEGTDEDVLNAAIGHERGTAQIGEAGNCVLCGHNGCKAGTFFTNLKKVRIGDVVRLTDRFGDVTEYEVVGTRIVEPRESAAVKDTDGTEKLTLYTCAEHGTKRLVCDCVPKQ
jgi:sortase A